MSEPNVFILYVDNPRASAAFYARLLDKPAVETSDTFALFALESGAKLGLWSRHTVEPAAAATGGGGEISFALRDRDAVQALHKTWIQRGLAVLQPPTEMDFGYTFVALDPDNHRLRVYAPAVS
jgi:predicted enzyme related to lactoylglutathione lyase